MSARRATHVHAFAAFACMLACADDPVVRVRFDAEELLRDQAARVSVRIIDALGVTRYDETRSRPSLPFTLPVRVVSPSPTQFTVRATLSTDDGRTVPLGVIVREPSRGGLVSLMFEARCAIECGSEETCVAGVCEELPCVSPASPPETPMRCAPAPDGGQQDGGADASPDAAAECEGCCDGDSCEEGHCVPPPERRAEVVGIWWRHACASNEAGSTWCWGNNEDRQLGVDDDGPLPPTYLGDFGRVFLAGPSHTCAFGSDGERRCWGANDYGQLGLGDSEPRVSPELASDGIMWRLVVAGIHFSCGLSDAGEAWCWGSNLGGQLARPVALADSSVPLRIELDDGSAPSFDTLDLGLHFALATSNGRLFGWGQNATSRRTLSSQVPAGAIDTPTLIPLGEGVRVAQVSGGQVHTCALTDAGAIYCWGAANDLAVGRPRDGLTGEVGEVAHPDGLRWRAEMPIPLATASTLSAGLGHTCAIDAEGSLYCWGSNAAQQLGIGLGEPSSHLPRRVTPVAAPWTFVAAGSDGTCATTTRGALYCWGRNTDGMLGLPESELVAPRPQRVCLPAP